jgi:hypothetical protein
MEAVVGGDEGMLRVAVTGFACRGEVVGDWGVGDGTRLAGDKELPMASLAGAEGDACSLSFALSCSSEVMPDTGVESLSSANGT